MDKGISVVKPSKLVVHITKCGFDTFASGYTLIEDTNALKMAIRVNSILEEGFNVIPHFRYDFACALLGTLRFDKEKLLKDIDTIKDRIINWEMKK